MSNSVKPTNASIFRGISGCVVAQVVAKMRLRAPYFLQKFYQLSQFLNLIK